MRRLVPVLLLTLVSANVFAEHEDEAAGSGPRLHIGGFTDVNFFATDEDKDPSSGFSEGQFVLHFTSVLGKRVSFFGEVSLSARSSDYKVDVERAIIKIDASDALRVSFGRYHTPINWWNTAFHHGQWLQTTVSRPEMTKFGGDFIPVHFVGALVEGKTGAGGLNLGYKAGLGNGRSEILSRAGDAGDVNDSRAWLVNLSVRPDRLYSLQAGLAYYRDRLDFEIEEVAQEYDESIASAFLAWTREDPEVIAELARTDHEDRISGATYDASAYYLQVAYRLPVWKARLKPYARYERIDVEAEDAVYANLDDRQGVLGGVRYDFSDFLAIKVEYRHIRTNDEEYVDSSHAQICIAF